MKESDLFIVVKDFISQAQIEAIVACRKYDSPERVADTLVHTAGDKARLLISVMRDHLKPKSQEVVPPPVVVQPPTPMQPSVPVFPPTGHQVENVPFMPNVNPNNHY